MSPLVGKYALWIDRELGGSDQGTITEDLGDGFFLVMVADVEGMQKVISLAADAAGLLLFDSEAAAKAWLAGPSERVVSLVKRRPLPDDDPDPAA
jgi:hypothetical protein